LTAIPEDKMLKASWGELSEFALGTVEELDRLLDQLQSEHSASPVLVMVEFSASGDSLMIGLGKEDSVVNFVSGSGNPPYWVSVGNHAEHDLVVFDFMGSHTEILRRHLIPVSLARHAMRVFVQTGTLCRNVQWEEC
jgi:hypothetical protein